MSVVIYSGDVYEDTENNELLLVLPPGYDEDNNRLHYWRFGYQHTHYVGTDSWVRRIKDGVFRYMYNLNDFAVESGYVRSESARYKYEARP